ncbi:hypothetical protein [Streptomyces qinglanensis]|uniref:Uncharacterized protein n=1 Tax=Streptomyces qinglanensis TaxID=943816 RepID=A0A1H9U1G0_9ACTN|nr:hypothetical protein [Streptomyces qinglanensis]SES02997.1 hypothetical protein SAMN05421870_107192 [Streptomyces qinglanensis]
MPENPDSPVQSLRRHLREHLHRYGRSSLGSPFLNALWNLTGPGPRADCLRRVAWHARHQKLTWPVSLGTRYAADLQQAARLHSDLGAFVVPLDSLPEDCGQQMEAALVLLAVCPDRRAALPVEIAEPGDTT